MGFLDENGLIYFWEKVRGWMEEQAANLMPAGAIVIWSGAEDAVPAGWALCDGTNGTPDLRGRFVLGASEDRAAGETGGEEEVTLTVRQMPRHDHELVQAMTGETAVSYSQYRKLKYGTLDYYNSYSISTGGTGSDLPNYYPTVTYMGDTGKSEPHPNMPPYYVLAYIMKLEGGSGSWK